MKRISLFVVGLAAALLTPTAAIAAPTAADTKAYTACLAETGNACLLDFIDQHLDDLSVEKAGAEQLYISRYAAILDGLNSVFFVRHDRARFNRSLTLLTAYADRYAKTPDRLVLGAKLKPTLCSRKALFDGPISQRAWSQSVEACAGRTDLWSFVVDWNLYKSWPNKDKQALVSLFSLSSPLRPPLWDQMILLVTRDMRGHFDLLIPFGRLDSVKPEGADSIYQIAMRKATLVANADPDSLKTAFAPEKSVDQYADIAVAAGKKLTGKQLADLMMLLPEGDAIPAKLRTFHQEKAKAFLKTCTRWTCISYVGIYISKFRDLDILKDWPVVSLQAESVLDVMAPMGNWPTPLHDQLYRTLRSRLEKLDAKFTTGANAERYQDLMHINCAHLPLEDTCQKALQTKLLAMKPDDTMGYITALNRDHPEAPLRKLLHHYFSGYKGPIPVDMMISGVLQLLYQQSQQAEATS